MTEPYLCNPKNTIEVLQKNEIRMQKRFGQNFLIDSHVLDKIMKAAKIDANDLVLEIGPGIGTMTQYLAAKAYHVVAVEIDQTLIPVLHENLSDWDNITLINQDILKIDLQEVLKPWLGDHPLKVVANLPYYITTPIIMNLFESDIPLDAMTVMVQKEVAQRMLASPGSKDYGALTLAIQYHASGEIVANVPPNCFLPRPNVGSAVVCLKKLSESSADPLDEKEMFRLIKAAFGQRRKTLANAISNSKEISYSREETENALESLGLDKRIRGEELSLKNFSDLCNKLISVKKQ